MARDLRPESVYEAMMSRTSEGEALGKVFEPYGGFGWGASEQLVKSLCVSHFLVTFANYTMAEALI